MGDRLGRAPAGAGRITVEGKEESSGSPPLAPDRLPRNRRKGDVDACTARGPQGQEVERKTAVSTGENSIAAETWFAAPTPNAEGSCRPTSTSTW